MRKVKYLKNKVAANNLCISVIIPARNEAKRITPLLNSLKKQTYKKLEIIIVDDQSEDSTAEYCRKEGFQVYSVKKKPEKWNGKSYACHIGASQTIGDMLLFLDADVEFNDGFIDLLISNYESGILSVQPFHKIGKITENLSLFFNIIITAPAFSLFSKTVKNPVLFGPCIMISRKHYDLSGGHISVKENHVDDISLAVNAAEKQIPITNYLGGKDLSFRMYPEGLKSIINGWTKNTGYGSVHTGWKTILTIVIWITGIVNSVIGMLIPVLYTSSIPMIFSSILVYSMYVFQLIYLAAKTGSFKKFLIFLYPLHFIFFLLVFFRSLYNTYIIKRVIWKKRTLST